jgi:tetratricopeptide (TPR) repeat protein
MQWAMKDLTVSPTLLTIDSASVGSAENTCATETTAHSPTPSSQSNHKGMTLPLTSKENNNQNDEHQMKNRLAPFENFKSKKKNQPRSQTTIPMLHVIPFPAPSAKAILLPPPRNSSNRHPKLIPRLSNAIVDPEGSRALFPVSTTLTSPPSHSLLPITFAVFEEDENSSNATTLTPISPKQLAFGDYDSLSPADLIDASAVVTGYNELPVTSQTKLAPPSQISVVMFLSSGQVSPLTPSPTLNLPPVRRHARKPRPVALERILSKSKVVGRHKSNKESDPAIPLSLNTAEQPSEITDNYCSCRTDESLEIDTSVNGRKQIPAGVQRNDKADETNCNSKRSTRSIRKSVPVDVDDVRFIDLEENLDMIGEMAEEYLSKGQYEEAVDVMKEILRRNLELHGHEHESVGLTLHNIASAQMRRKKYAKAIQTGLKAVQVRQRALGEQHQDVAATLVLLGLSHFERKQYGSALEYFESALNIRKIVFGPAHVKIAKLINNIACTLKAMGRLGDALSVFGEGLQMQRGLLASMPSTIYDVDIMSGARKQLALSIVSTLANVCTLMLSLNLVDGALGALDEAYQVSHRRYCTGATPSS